MRNLSLGRKSVFSRGCRRRFFALKNCFLEGKHCLSAPGGKIISFHNSFLGGWVSVRYFFFE